MGASQCPSCGDDEEFGSVSYTSHRGNDEQNGIQFYSCPICLNKVDNYLDKLAETNSCTNCGHFKIKHDDTGCHAEKMVLDDNGKPKFGKIGVIFEPCDCKELEAKA
ncbi:MAG: hypothetical protein J4F28_02135 [Nitrosopumilaceae archaeon]|nr:hypothetical protein [Nitrosopumilaceae archaeon]